LTPAEAIRQGSKNFALASLFLPARCRDRALILYQWCRNCDDAIDEAPDVEAARIRLTRMEDRDFAGPALAGPDWLDAWQRSEFIAGMRMDVEGRHYANLQELEQYCFRVAGVIGLMMCPLLGAQADVAPPHAVSLGNAMQLTNIARDIQADARMGRIYLPENLLRDVDMSPDVLATQPELAYPAVKLLLSRAEELYEHGFQGIAWLPWRVAFAIAVAGKVYQRIGHKLLRAASENPAAAFRQRTVVSIPGKFVAVASAVWLVLRIKIFSRPWRPGIRPPRTTTMSPGYPG
jgi:phytoene synthase